MYVIKYNDGIYAGTYSDMDGIYCYPSDYFNKCKPKVFKTLKGAERHLHNLKNNIVWGNDESKYNFRILEWSEKELLKHLNDIVMNEEERFKFAVSFRPRKDTTDDTSIDEILKDKKLEKYWKKVFKPLRNQEIEITNISVVNNLCTINYMMPYCTFTEEYIFQVDTDKETVIDGFCDTVETRANEMITMIRGCSNIRNLF